MNGNESAFTTLRKVGDVIVAEGGLTKRELMASMQMQGIMANPNRSGSLWDLSLVAVGAADALLEWLK